MVSPEFNTEYTNNETGQTITNHQITEPEAKQLFFCKFISGPSLVTVA